MHICRYVTSWDGINWDQMGGGVSNPITCAAAAGGLQEAEEPAVYALALMGGTDKAAPREGTSVPPSQYGTERERPRVFVGGRCLICLPYMSALWYGTERERPRVFVGGRFVGFGSLWAAYIDTYTYYICIYRCIHI